MKTHHISFDIDDVLGMVNRKVIRLDEKPIIKPKKKVVKHEETRTLLEQLNDFIDLSDSMKEDFELHWGAIAKNGKPLWQNQKTWDLKRRLRTWKKNQEKWDWERSQRFIKDEEPNSRREVTNSGASSLGDLLKQK